MTKGLIGKKIGMTQIFDEAGKVVPVTVIEAGPCVVTQLKTAENDGYEAVIFSISDIVIFLPVERTVLRPLFCIYNFTRKKRCCQEVFYDFFTVLFRQRKNGILR